MRRGAPRRVAAFPLFHLRARFRRWTDLTRGIVRGAEELCGAGAHHRAAVGRAVVLQGHRHLRQLDDEEALQLHLPHLWRWGGGAVRRWGEGERVSG